MTGGIFAGFAHIAATLAPIFLVILLGYGLRQFLFTGSGIWDGAQRITYYIFLPVLLVTSIANADLAGVQLYGMALGLAGGTLITALLVRLVHPLLAVDGPAYSPLFQGSIRCGAYVSITTASVLLGEAGVSLIFVSIVIIVPLTNILAVIVLVNRNGLGTGWQHLAVSIASNPMILACALGVVLNVSEIGLPVVGELLLGTVG